MSYMAGVLYETETAYPSRAPGSSPGFGGFRVVHPYSFLCCFCFVLFDFFLCLVCSMLPVSLDFLFLIAPSVFSNVYSHSKQTTPLTSNF
jgi:hypothetical protein